MIMRKPLAYIAVTALFAGTGCSPASPGEELSGWLGGEMHLVAEGRLAGEDVSIDIRGAQAEDVGKLWCDREYRVPMSGGHPDYAAGELREFALNGYVFAGAEQRRFEIEFKEYNFRNAVAGTRIDVTPRDDSVSPGPSQMWFEWEWHQVPSDDELLEASAQAGTIDVEQITGTPDASGLVIPENEGTFGAFVEARWTESDQVKMSFTMKCTTNDIVLVE